MGAGCDVVREAGPVRERIGLTGQYAALDDYLSGRANLIMIGQLGLLPGREAKRRADELLDRFDLTGAAGRAVKTYSGRDAAAAGPGGQPDPAAPRCCSWTSRPPAWTRAAAR